MKRKTLTAITRAVGPNLPDCELTFLARQKIDVAKAIKQHRCYEECLERLGVRVMRLPAEPDLPDSVFVEDTAIALDELAVITRPGATSRQVETESVADALSEFRPLKFIQPPATINAARMIGREKDSGTIEEGKVADLLILDANPLDDIRNIKQIHRIIKGGTVFDPAELLKR